MSGVFTQLWPCRAAPAQRRALSRAVEALAAMLRTTPDDRDALERAAADFYTHLATARQYTPLLRFERGRDDRDLVLAVVQGLFIPIDAIVRTPVPATASSAARAALSSATESVSIWLGAFAASIASHGPAPQLPASDPALGALDRIASDEHESTDTRERLADQIAWLDLLRSQCAALAERRPT
jgi:hypothetical protein